MHIESPAFEHHQPIPKKYTCEGEDISPPLNIKDIPAGTKSLALIMDDPDAPSGTFVHWVAWNIDPSSSALPEDAELTNEGRNNFQKIGYGGPCPPPGKPHRYFFKLYALGIRLNIKEGANKKDLEEAMEGHIIGHAELVGTYKR